MLDFRLDLTRVAVRDVIRRQTRLLPTRIAHFHGLALYLLDARRTPVAGG